jgi:hypothetical protein
MVRFLRTGVVLGALFAPVLFTSIASAQTVTIKVDATVSYVDDYYNLLGGQVQVGDKVTGTYSYDLSTPDSNGLSTVGDYWSSTGGFDLMLNGQPVRTTQGAPWAFLVEMINNHYGSDHYLLRSYYNEPNAWGPVQHVSWQLDDYTMTALSSEALLAGPPDIGAFGYQWGLDIEGGSDYYYPRYFIRSTVDSVSLLPRYNFSGFSAPIAAAPATNSAKAGQAVPVKFSLGADEGLAIFAAGSPSSMPVDCTTMTPLGASVSATQPGGSTLTYDAASGQYSFVWKTEKAWANSCRYLVVGLADGSVHSALFQFRK